MEKEVHVRTDERDPFLSSRPANRLLVFYRNHKYPLIVTGVMVLLLPLLGLIALKNHKVQAQYTSPIVYPSPQTYGAGNWSAAYEKAVKLVSNLTLAEMNNITIGYSNVDSGCVGVSGSAPRVGFPGLCLHDAGNGVRDTDGVNAYASGLHIGASWNVSLAYQRALFMGAEFKTKGVNVALGPVVGPIGRIAEGGRNWEGFAADPYLNGMLGASSVTGLQQNVISSVKHFIAYEQETNRNPSTSDGDTIQSTSANVDDRTLHELYLWPFQDLIYAGAGCVMCSYNRINNTYACENSKTINGLLKGELNFQGFVVSDWAGQHSGLSSANAGLDMAMPTTAFWNDDQLANAVENNALNRTRLVDMATRIIATWYQFGQDDPTYPPLGVGMAKDLLSRHNYVNARDPAAKPSLLEQAIEGHVLVKNVNNALPLTNPRVLSLFGYDGVSQVSFDPGQGSWGQNWEAINLTGPQVAEIASNSPVLNGPQTMMGTLIVGGGSGSNTPAYISSPYEALQQRAYVNDTSLFYDFSSREPDVVTNSDACLVFINEYSSETWDRPSLADPDSDDLVNSVASQCNNTIVVIHNAGIRIVDAWIENPNVTAVIFAHLPGQDAGRALVQILYGDVSPSGRLPYTVAKQPTDYDNLLSPCQADGSDSPQCTFTEGTEIDYRSFLARNVTPRYEFGYGLTYTTFAYSALSVEMNATAGPVVANAPVYTNGTANQNANLSASATAAGTAPPVGVGGLTALYAPVGRIAATIRNSGAVAGAEVAQLYIGIPAPPAAATATNVTSAAAPRVLRGFQKVALEPGLLVEVEFPLRAKDLAYWDVVNQTWALPTGTFEVWVGRSVLDTPLRGSFTL